MDSSKHQRSDNINNRRKIREGLTSNHLNNQHNGRMETKGNNKHLNIKGVIRISRESSRPDN